MTAVESMELRNSLAAELEKADKVIAVLLAHLSAPMRADKAERMQRVIDDLAARGLADHDTTRTELLREVYG